MDPGIEALYGSRLADGSGRGGVVKVVERAGKGGRDRTPSPPPAPLPRKGGVHLRMFGGAGRAPPAIPVAPTPPVAPRQSSGRGPVITGPAPTPGGKPQAVHLRLGGPGPGGRGGTAPRSPHYPPHTHLTTTHTRPLPPPNPPRMFGGAKGGARRPPPPPRPTPPPRPSPPLRLLPPRGLPIKRGMVPPRPTPPVRLAPGMRPGPGLAPRLRLLPPSGRPAAPALRLPPQAMQGARPELAPRVGPPVRPVRPQLRLFNARAPPPRPGPLPPRGPPRPPLPPSAPAPGGRAVTFSLSLHDMSMASYDVGVNAALKADLAAKLGVGVDRVLVNARSGSVVLSVAVAGFEGAAAAMAAAQLVSARAGELVNPAVFGRSTVADVQVCERGGGGRGEVGVGGGMGGGRGMPPST